MRVSGWEDAVLAVIERHSATPYAAGSADCFVMAMDAIEALTGTRPYAQVRYRSDKGALLQLARRGFPRLGDAIGALFPERPRGLAQRGDIAVLNSDKGDTLGIVWGGVVVCRVGHAVSQAPLAGARIIYAID